ncbi:hypothetical protein NST50_05215 [Paenibacillus sp. FSL E2-0202]|uniref:hypothetical protein n=1 Tax=Paenibacillus sp. FSL E2-0202 TaxID=2954505 RepID=UPI0030EE133A
MTRKSKSEVEKNRLEKQRIQMKRWEIKQAAAKAREAKAKEQKRLRDLNAHLRKQRAIKRVEIPSQYVGESIFVHKRIYEGFMKDKTITIQRMYPVGGSGGKLVIEFKSRAGKVGELELQDLGLMP